MLKQLERKFGRICVPHLTWLLIGGQVMFYLGIQGNPDLLGQMQLIPNKVLEGEVWRLLVFLFIPQYSSPVWFAIAMYVLYLMGSALESHWGEFRYNLYIFIGMLGTIGASFLSRDTPATNVYLMMSIFLAFAYLYPDFEFLLFFILPVKVKYLGMLTAAMLGLQFLGASMAGKLLISAAFLNFSLFFGADIMRRIKGSNKRMGQKIAAIKDASAPFHTCSICKRTDKSDPQLHFRYLPGESEPVCYCEDHLPE
jgi:hypothetical protein